MQVSFGKRIPIYKCQVTDMATGKNMPAVISEYDCEDYEDIQEMTDLGYKWKFALCLSADMHSKLLYNRDPRFTKRNYPMHFYILHDEKEDKYGCVNIFGICETEENKDNTNIAFIESKYDKKHKYVGQTMIASIGKTLLKRNGHNIYILNPAYNAIPYYINKCGFETVTNTSYSPLWMQTHQIPDFIKRTEEKTGASIIDINA